jgi:hypothetical protein
MSAGSRRSNEYPPGAVPTPIGSGLKVRYPTDFVEEPPVLARRLGFWSALSEADSCLVASCGEYGRRKGDELRQFSQILGCGG